MRPGWRKCPNELWDDVEPEWVLMGRLEYVWVRFKENTWQVLATFTEGGEWEDMVGAGTLEEAQQVAEVRFRMESKI